MAKRKQQVKTKENATPKEPIIPKIKTLFKDERFKFVSGISILFLSAYMFFSFISFIFTWKKDQNHFDLSWIDYFFNSKVEVANWMGKFGARIANFFIWKSFGIASFALIFVLIVLGLKLIKVRFVSLQKTIKYSIIGIIWSSLTFSFLFGESLMGGGHGIFLNEVISGIIGKTGTGFIIFITLFAFIVFTFPKAWLWIRAFFFLLFSQKSLKNAFLEAKHSTSVIKQQNTTNDGEIKQNQETVNTITNKDNLELQNINKATNQEHQLDENLSKSKVQMLFFDDEQELQTTESKKYILKDDGQELDTKLGFEVENTNTNKFDEVISSAEKLDDKLNNRHALEVEKNKDIESQNVGELGEYDPTLDLSNYQLPPLELLFDHGNGTPEVTNEELISNKNKIVETLAHYKIEITKIKATIGPTITLYEIIPAPGVRISKIKNLEDDIALSLSALGIRIIAPMPGRGTIGIEVPNQKPEIVSMKSVLASAKFQESKMELPIALGKTISNETYVFDLTKMPHMLVAGATGQGKSVGLNAILTSLLFKKHPSQVKLVLVDPKKVELTLYEKIERHYLAKLPDMEEPIITDNQKVIHTLNSLNVEMDNRYNLLKDAQVRNIKEYNTKFISRRLNPEKGHRYLPYIVLIVDEFADLIMTAGKEVELPIARLAQLSRAIGIHLIIATQRPSTNIITGVIKANFPTRIAFKVASMVDSRTILDTPGANQLVGRGDMLITQGSDLIRLQCAFIDTPELEKITDFIGNQRGYPSAFLLPEPDIEASEGVGNIDLSQRDDLFDDAARIVVVNQQGSTSLIQRKLSIGYNRAGRIIDQLEAAGIVGPFEGSKARQVLFQDEYSLEQFLNQLNNRN